MNSQNHLDADEDTNRPHLRVYEDRSVLYGPDRKRLRVFREGSPTSEASDRANRIRKKLHGGYLESIVKTCREGRVNFETLTSAQEQLIRELVDSVTSEVGRAVLGLAILQMIMKAIEPNQNVRLHKGGKGEFSWTEGISMRTVGSKFVTPVLREEGLLNVNQFGVMMTRSLAENYPYTVFYKASIRGAKQRWLELVDLLEVDQINAELALKYCISLLIKKSENFQKLASEVVRLAEEKANALHDPSEVLELLLRQMTKPAIPVARLLEVSMHSLMQAIQKMGLLGDMELRPLSQMRKANKKAGDIGDIELERGKTVAESWDAKYGKIYLFDDLSELRDKLIQEKWPSLQIAGFVTDKEPDLREEIVERMRDMTDEFGIEISILSLPSWVKKQLARVPRDKVRDLAREWLTAYAESLALRRTSIAPIDEPTEAWLQVLKDLLS